MLTPKEIMPHSVYRTLILLKRRLSGNLSRGALTIVNYCEQLHGKEGRVILSTERDQPGMNRLALDWRVDSEVHGVANLNVTGSSVFATCGNANPTWTIVALALRLGDHLN